MELKIISPGAEGFIKAIEWNNEEIKAEIAEKVSTYKMMVYSEDQIKEAKADRAELNKFVKKLEDKRKEIKGLCLAPYENFEKQMKELVAIVNEPIQVIDDQIKAYESEQKAKKAEEIRAYYATKNCEIPLDKFYDKKWENATTSMSSVKQAIDSKVEEISADLKIIRDEKEYIFEALEAYKKTLDIRYVMAEINRLKEVAAKKAEFEKAQAEINEKKTEVVETPTTDGIDEIGTSTPQPQTEENFIPDFASIGDNRHYVTFKARVDFEQHAELIAFLDEKHIEYTVL